METLKKSVSLVDTLWKFGKQQEWTYQTFSSCGHQTKLTNVLMNIGQLLSTFLAKITYQESKSAAKLWEEVKVMNNQLPKCFILACSVLMYFILKLMYASWVLIKEK